MLSTPAVDEFGFYILTSPVGTVAEILVASFGVRVGASNDLLSVAALGAPLTHTLVRPKASGEALGRATPSNGRCLVDTRRLQRTARRAIRPPGPVTLARDLK